MLPRYLIRSSILALGILVLGWVPSASAVPIVGGGIDLAHACLDTAVSCAGEANFSIVGTGAATGTVTINPAGVFPTHTVDLDVDVSSLILTDTGGAVDGVDWIMFTSLTFDVTGIPALNSGGTLILVGTPLVTVTGFYEQFLGASSVVGPTFFSQNVSLTSLACATDGSGNCGFGLQSTGAFPLNLNVGTTGGGTGHDFGFTFNVAIPEPSTATLLGLGLIGLVGTRRRRS